MISRDPSRNLNRRDSTLWSSLVSVDLTSDDISATGGRQRFAHAGVNALGRDDTPARERVAGERRGQSLVHLR